jgi:hypothetical protein
LFNINFQYAHETSILMNRERFINACFGPTCFFIKRRRFCHDPHRSWRYP